MDVEQVSWPPEHSQALREYHAKGMSYSQIAKALNARFAMAYTRSAALGRAKRMGLVGSDQTQAQQPMLERMLRERAAQARISGAKLSDTRPAGLILSEFGPRKPAFAKVKPLSFAASMFPHATSRWSNLSGTTAGTPMAATRTVQPSPFAGTRAARAQAIAPPIST